MKCFGIVLVLALAGCSFGQGFKDELLRQLPGVAADAVDAKLGPNFKELSAGLKDVGGKIPQPKGPVDEGLGYSLGALVAYTLGSSVKGLIRAKFGGKGDKEA